MALQEFDFENIPTVSIVKNILTDAIKMKATDIHCDPTSDDLVIKFRINGNLKEYTTAPDNIKTNIITRIKIISGMNITNTMFPQTGAINFELNSKNHNMRVSSLPIVDGEKIVIHISNYARNIKSISKMGFSEDNIKKIKELVKEQQGIILITGSTNSGKTTTTYSILKELNSKSNNIISIEDPIKMKIKGINQVELAPEKGLNYRNILKHILLQDPNIIAINELVDEDTTRSALRASVTGRLVISTMNTKTAYQTIDTLLNMNIENYLLSSNLVGIISQRLVKRLCPTCRERKKASDYEKKVFKAILNKDIEELFYPKGCEECTNGYLEQIPTSEVIIIDNELKNAIANNKNRELIRNIIYEGNNSIIKDGLNKVLEGLTSFQEIIKIIDLKTDFTEEEEKIKQIIIGNDLENKEIQETPPREETTLKQIEENNNTTNNKISTENTINNEKNNTQEQVPIKVPDTEETTTIQENKKEEQQIEENKEVINDNMEKWKNISKQLNVSDDDLKNILSKIEEDLAKKKQDLQNNNATNEIAQESPENNPTENNSNNNEENNTNSENNKQKEENIQNNTNINTDTNNTNNNDNKTSNEPNNNTEIIATTNQEQKEQPEISPTANNEESALDNTNKNLPTQDVLHNNIEENNMPTPVQQEITPTEEQKEVTNVKEETQMNNIQQKEEPINEEPTTNTPNEIIATNNQPTVEITTHNNTNINNNNPITNPAVVTNQPLIDEDDDDDFNYDESYINNF